MTEWEGEHGNWWYVIELDWRSISLGFGVCWGKGVGIAVGLPFLSIAGGWNKDEYRYKYDEIAAPDKEQTLWHERRVETTNDINIVASSGVTLSPHPVTEHVIVVKKRPSAPN